MGRTVSQPISEAFTREHEAAGVRYHLGQGVERIVPIGDKVNRVDLSGGQSLVADLVVYGIGVTPRAALAADAGLEVADGVCVDEFLSTTDPAVSAIGDVASFPGRRLRLESVQNATDQARAVAARLVGKPTPYAAVA